MPLTGRNKSCSRCKKLCKQYKQIEVIICPNFVSNRKVNAKAEKPA